MRKSIFALMLALSVSWSQAQWMRPAREIRTETNTWTYIPTSKTNVQLVINWLDAELADFDATLSSLTFDGSAFTVLPRTTNALQPVLDWIDSHWNTNITAGLHYLKGTNIVGAIYDPTNLTWTLPATGVPVSTSSWTVIAPTSTTAQASLDAIDAALGYVNSNLNVASVAGAAKWAYNNGYSPGVDYSGDGSALVALTNGLESATTSNTNVLRWGYGSDAGKLFIGRNGTYFFYAALAASGTNNINHWYAYLYHYDSANSLKGTAPVGTITAQALDHAGTYIAMSAEAGDYLRLLIGDVGSAGSYGNTVTLGAQYLFAYKVYNTD